VSGEPSTNHKITASAEAEGIDLDAERPPDAKADLFRTGLATLTALMQQPETKARALLGTLLRDAGGNAQCVLDALDRARDNNPVAPLPWLRQAVRRRHDAAPAMPAGKAEPVPDEIAGYIVAAVIDRTLDELGVGDLRFPDLPRVIVSLLRESFKPDAIYATASAIARRGSVETMRSAAYLASAVRNRSRDGHQQQPTTPFNVDTTP
jgi:hypothetical protein